MLHRHNANIRKLVGAFLMSIPDSLDTAQQVEDYFADQTLTDEQVGEVTNAVDTFLIDSGRSINEDAMKELEEKRRKRLVLYELVHNIVGADTPAERAVMLKRAYLELGIE